jgi:hypothetical protein
MRVTLKAVNDRLAELGYHGLLEKGDAVKVRILSSIALDQWVAEFQRLKKLNEGMLRPPVKKKRR